MCVELITRFEPSLVLTEKNLLKFDNRQLHFEFYEVGYFCFVDKEVVMISGYYLR